MILVGFLRIFVIGSIMMCIVILLCVCWCCWLLLC